MKGIPVFYAELGDTPWHGMHNISLVESPAVEVDFVKLSSETPRVCVDKEKMMLFGPVLIPEIPIYRVDGDGDGYILKFSADTISKIKNKWMSSGLNQEFSLEHSGYALDKWKVNLSEVWIKEYDEDKSNSMGFSLPIGTMFVGAKVNDVELWDRIKDGEFKGFSIESIIDLKYSRMEKMLFSKVELGAPVLKMNKEGVVEHFSGSFETHDSVIVVGDDGLIKSVTPLEPETTEVPAEVQEKESSDKGKATGEAKTDEQTPVTNELTEDATVAGVLKQVETLSSIVTELETSLAGYIKAAGEMNDAIDVKLARINIASKQASAPEVDKNQGATIKMSRLDQISALNKFFKNLNKKK